MEIYPALSAHSFSNMGNFGSANVSGNCSVFCLEYGWSRERQECADHIHRCAWIDPACSVALTWIVSYGER